jgi:hypothetical protein
VTRERIVWRNITIRVVPVAVVRAQIFCDSL